ncbi:helix-turn-helix domain-containing protein [Bifidobacterium sp. SMB2]|uniref:Helix-turn-helix domain-containing protein n=1 Tax=Bifidobacterium saimiriisciurei TaxID=2661627 RepID=A0ABX0CCD1_9BIFI|nr:MULTISPECIES: helix-turn-helix transcriptional regulator [Bifidobacterium]NEG96212.1 helix-turn-helix domain-containing protein [Bifidobacterium sp. SMB2]NEH12225.1 helix-turn-helix domain-containing protein [Bifidobacterium saimiriisciurei]
MTFRTNLQYLRSRRNMTQEQLAMLLGVSRQAISKWESEKAYPEMDKLLAICDLFGCTLDDLVLGDVSRPGVAAGGGFDGGVGGGAGDGAAGSAGGADDGIADGAAGSSAEGRDGAGRPATDGETGAAEEAVAARGARTAARPVSTAPSSPGAPGESGAHPTAAALPKDLTGYDDHRRRFALLIASGVAAIIAGVGVANLFDSEHSMLGASPLNDFLTFACICMGVVVGLALLIPAVASHAAFKRRHPYVEDFYTEDDYGRESRLLVFGVVAGVAAILVGIAVAVYAGDVMGVDAGWPNMVMLLLDAAAVFGFVYCGIRRSMLNIVGYNRDVETERRKRAGTLPFSARLSGAVSGIIMLVATIVGLGLLFFGVDDFWIPWPVGGLLCAVAGIVIELFKDRFDR